MSLLEQMQELGGDEFKTTNGKFDYKQGLTLGKVKESIHGRNEFMASYVGKLCHSIPKHDWNELLMPTIQSINQTVCDPPLTQKELESVVDSITNTYDHSSHNKRGDSTEKSVEHIREIFQPISHKELLEKDFPEEEWRVKSLIPAESLTVIASPSGVGKTWLALALSLSVAKGESFLDQPEHEAKQGKVLYLNAEMTEREFKRRCVALGFQDLDNDNFTILTTYELNLNSDNAVSVLKEYVETHDIDMVIIDTFRPFALGVEENDGQKIRGFFHRFNPLRDSGRSIVVLDHNRKKGPNDYGPPKKEHLIGSQDKMSSVDFALMLCEKQAGKTIEIHQVKVRNGASEPPFAFAMEDDLYSQRVFLLPAVPQTEEETKKEVAKGEIVRVLSEYGQKTTEELMQIIQNEDIGKNAIEQGRKELVEEGSIETHRVGRTPYYFVPEEEDEESEEEEDEESLRGGLDVDPNDRRTW